MSDNFQSSKRTIFQTCLLSCCFSTRDQSDLWLECWPVVASRIIMKFWKNGEREEGGEEGQKHDC